MHLKILSPHTVIVDEHVHKILAEGHNGVFCLLPRHTDFATALAPGLLSFINATDEEVFLAVDEGILIKRADSVMVSTRRAFYGDTLDSLKTVVQEQFKQFDEQEKHMRSSLARLEADFVRRFVEHGGHHEGI